MKRFFLVLCILCIPVFLFGQWVDTSGSTWVATAADVEWEIKDIQNAVIDQGLSSWKVTITSGLQFVYVLVSTSTDFVGAKLEKIYVRDSSGTAKIVSDLEKAYVLSSTNTSTIMTEMIKHYVLISTGGDTTIIRLDSANTKLNEIHIGISTTTDKLYILTSTGTDGVNTRLDKLYVLISTSASGTDAILDKLFVQNSTAADTTVQRLDSLSTLKGTGTDTTVSRLDSLSTLKGTGTDTTVSRLDSMNTVVGTGTDITVSRLDSIYNQQKTSVTISYKIDNSTYVYRNFYENGTLTVNFNVKSIGVYSQGGDSAISWDGGDIMDVWEGIPFGDVSIDETFVSPVVFTHTLSAPTTFSIYVRGRL